MDVFAGLIIGVTVVVLVTVMALVARQLLGVRFGLTRLLLAGCLALAVSGPISRALSSGVPTESSAITPLWFLFLSILFTLLVAMVFLVVAEAAVDPPRSAATRVRRRTEHAARSGQPDILAGDRRTVAS